MEKPRMIASQRFESDVEGLRQAESVLKNEGYSDLQLVKSQRRHHIFRLKDAEGMERFVKAAVEPAEFIFLENEVRANDLLRPLTEGISLRIPEGRYQSNTKGAWADFEFLEGKPFADEGKLLMPFRDEELEVLFQFQLRKQDFEEKDLPEFFLQRARTEFSEAVMVEKLTHAYLGPATGPVISEDEARRLRQMFIDTGAKRGFAHHDFVAWNMLRNSQNEVVLTDPEHARWGFKWYDLAYNYLQTRILLQNPDEAKRQLTFFLKRFKEELPHEEIEKEILHPLAYWTGASAFHAASIGRPEILQPVRELVSQILTRDLMKIL